MTHSIPPVQPGDKVAVVSPAKHVGAEIIAHAVKVLKDFGFIPVVGKNAAGKHHYFSGSIEERVHDMQQAIDDPEIKAIFCARGGYGCIQLVDRLQWAGMLRHPKWIVGFSDVTIFHHKMLSMGFPSIHATMPLNYGENTPASFETLLKALTAKPYTIRTAPFEKNKPGFASGKLVGGNLSIVYSLLGTIDQIKYTNCILFVEDLSEHLYMVDRMFHSLAKAGVLEEIKGLIIGGMSNMKDTEDPYGSTLEDILLAHFAYRKIPICFHFPAGHINDNHALRLGSMVEMSVSDEGVVLQLH